jgi:hypothetical protein
MYDLSFGAKIIDTPGIKGFGIVDMEKEEIGGYFPEFFNLKDPVIGGYTPEKIALRRAIIMGYDVDEEIRVIRKGQAVKAQQMVSPVIAGHDRNYKS